MDNSCPPPHPLHQAVEISTWQASNRASSPPRITSSLHSVKKPPSKSWKKPTNPPIPPKVYRVDPRGFRKLVQSLTGAPPPPETPPAHRRLRDSAPAPLDLVRQSYQLQQPLPTPPTPQADVAPVGHQSPATATGSFAGGFFSSSLFSPYSTTWCNFPLLSPGSMASLEQNTVL